MDWQKVFDFDAPEKQSAAIRSGLEPYGLPHWSVEFIVLMVRDGRPREINDHQTIVLEVSKREAARRMGCPGTTFMRARDHLRRVGVLEMLKVDQRVIYVLSRDRVNELAPICDDPIEDARLFEEDVGQEDHAADRPEMVVQGGPNRSALVRAGPGWSGVVQAPVSVKDVFIHPVDRVPVSVSSANTGARTSADHLGPARTSADHPTGECAVTLRDLTDEDVRQLRINRLRSAFYDAVEHDWLKDSHEDKRKFLAACHHASLSPGIHYPAKVVYAAVKRYDFSRVNQVSWDWAASKLRRQEEA